MAIDFNIYYLDESLFEVKLIDGKCNSLVIFHKINFILEIKIFFSTLINNQFNQIFTLLEQSKLYYKKGEK